MKKVYEKPLIMFEDFTMSTNIAAGCDKIFGIQNQNDCYIEGTGGIIMFDGDMNMCDHTPPEGSEYDGFCYHVPIDSKELFNS